VDRAALPAPEPRSAGVEAGGPPRTPAEEALAALWRELLGIDRLGREDNFFEVGGHSLLATQLVSRARQTFGVEVPLQQVFETPTIAGLAAWIEGLETGPETGPLEDAPRDRLAGLSRDQQAELFARLRQRRERAASPAGIPRRPPGLDPVPASFAQERFWFLDRLQPGSAAYSIPDALRLEGEASPALLAGILGEVVRRHEALRTTFEERGGRPVQVIAAPGRWALPLVDLGGLPRERRLDEAMRLAEEEASRPFDLGRGPLLRSTMLRLGATDHALLLTMHHIVSDGWSMGVLVSEITALYGAVLAGRPSSCRSCRSSTPISPSGSGTGCATTSWRGSSRTGGGVWREPPCSSSPPTGRARRSRPTGEPR
jgi:acyl carrier protein